MSLDKDDIDNRIKYHKPNSDGIEKIALMRKFALDWSYAIHGLVPDGREQALAYTKIEEALMWAIAGIARGPDNWSEDQNELTRP